MHITEWEPIYEQILSDMGYSREDDESCVRVLKAITVNSDLIDDEEAVSFFGTHVTVIGDAPCLEDDLRMNPVSGKTVVSGSAVGRVLSAGIPIDVIVTDLDGDIEPQIEASARGSLTFIHAHGDNEGLVRQYAWRFRGPVILTTQSTPENTVSNFGGFTDGDRAVCIASSFGAEDILLLGFDFDNPMPKDGQDPSMKKRKLDWARRIIEGIDGVHGTTHLLR